ncbi:MAG: hypothetical protein A3K41_17170 [Chloroflexi bacterium RIFOXYD12_FULL_57_15]|nr:MAG: hypothetical protein A3K41_17170 [Chloroflexi bacterium RIFOXYD12_FULL_57_15]
MLRSARNDAGSLQNKSPFADASGDWCDLSYLSTSHASPNAANGVIIVIVVIGEAKFGLHGGDYSTG